MMYLGAFVTGFIIAKRIFEKSKVVGESNKRPNVQGHALVERVLLSVGAFVALGGLVLKVDEALKLYQLLCATKGLLKMISDALDVVYDYFRPSKPGLGFESSGFLPGQKEEQGSSSLIDLDEPLTDALFEIPLNENKNSKEPILSAEFGSDNAATVLDEIETVLNSSEGKKEIHIEVKKTNVLYDALNSFRFWKKSKNDEKELHRAVAKAAIAEVADSDPRFVIMIRRLVIMMKCWINKCYSLVPEYSSLFGTLFTFLLVVLFSIICAFVWVHHDKGIEWMKKTLYSIFRKRKVNGEVVGRIDPNTSRPYQFFGNYAHLTNYVTPENAKLNLECAFPNEFELIVGEGRFKRTPQKKKKKLNFSGGSSDYAEPSFDSKYQRRYNKQDWGDDDLSDAIEDHVIAMVEGDGWGDPYYPVQRGLHRTNEWKKKNNFGDRPVVFVSPSDGSSQSHVPLLNRLWADDPIEGENIPYVSPYDDLIVITLSAPIGSLIELYKNRRETSDMSPEALNAGLASTLLNVPLATQALGKKEETKPILVTLPVSTPEPVKGEVIAPPPKPQQFVSVPGKPNCVVQLPAVTTLPQTCGEILGTKRPIVKIGTNDSSGTAVHIATNPDDLRVKALRIDPVLPYPDKPVMLFGKESLGPSLEPAKKSNAKEFREVVRAEVKLALQNATFNGEAMHKGSFSFKVDTTKKCIIPLYTKDGKFCCNAFKMGCSLITAYHCLEDLWYKDSNGKLWKVEFDQVQDGDRDLRWCKSPSHLSIPSLPFGVSPSQDVAQIMIFCWSSDGQPDREPDFTASTGPLVKGGFEVGTHFASTTHGVSGSPIFDSNGSVIGMHRGYYDNSKGNVALLFTDADMIRAQGKNPKKQ
jgi:hypothetical protein